MVGFLPACFPFQKKQNKDNLKLLHESFCDERHLLHDMVLCGLLDNIQISLEILKQNDPLQQRSLKFFPRTKSGPRRLPIRPASFFRNV